MLNSMYIGSHFPYIITFPMTQIVLVFWIRTTSLINHFVTHVLATCRIAYFQFFLILLITLLCSPNGSMNNTFPSFTKTAWNYINALYSQLSIKLAIYSLIVSSGYCQDGTHQSAYQIWICQSDYISYSYAWKNKH